MRINLMVNSINRFNRLQCLCGVIVLKMAWTLLPPVHGEAFLQVDDIEGESTVEGHVGWIEIDSFSAGLSTEIDELNLLRSVPARLKVGKEIDSSSPYLILASLQQASIPSVVLEASYSKSKESVILVRYELSNARVAAFGTTTESVENEKESTLHESWEFDFEEWASHYMRDDLEIISATWNFVDDTGGLLEDAPSRPLIAPLDVLLAEPGNTYQITLNLSDEDTTDEMIAVWAESLDPEKVTVLGLEGSGAERSLNIAVSEFFSGTATLRLWASDGSRSSSRTLMISIEGGETPYETFLIAAFGAALTEDSSLGLPIGDPDKDGLKTIAEFYLGTDPNYFTPRDEAIEVSQIYANGALSFHLRFFRRSDTQGLVGLFSLSSDIKTWVELGPESVPPWAESVESSDGPYELVSAQVELPLEYGEKAFLRLQVDGTF